MHCRFMSTSIMLAAAATLCWGVGLWTQWHHWPSGWEQGEAGRRRPESPVAGLSYWWQTCHHVFSSDSLHCSCPTPPHHFFFPNSPRKFYRSLFQKLPTVFMGVLPSHNSTNNIFFSSFFLINLTKYKVNIFYFNVFLCITSDRVFLFRSVSLFLCDFWIRLV